MIGGMVSDPEGLSGAGVDAEHRRCGAASESERTIGLALSCGAVVAGIGGDRSYSGEGLGATGRTTPDRKRVR